MRVTKQQRKYNIKPTEEKPKTKEVPKTKFRVLIDGSNFLPEKHASYEAAEKAGQAFCKRGGSYVVVEGCE